MIWRITYFYDQTIYWWKDRFIPLLHNMITSSNRNIFRVTGSLSPVNSPHKGQWRGDLMFSLICGWINGWVNNRETGDLRRHRTHYDVSVMVVNNAVAVSCLHDIFNKINSLDFDKVTSYLWARCTIDHIQICALSMWKYHTVACRLHMGCYTLWTVKRHALNTWCEHIVC